MPSRLRRHLTYANVMATAAMFIALGGSSYAAITITGKNVKNRSLTYKDLKKNTIGGSRVKESRLKTVPRASRVGGRTAAQLLVKCPAGTFPTGGTCIEANPRPALAYDSAVVTCQGAGGDATPGRRLPTHGELRAAFSRVNPAPGGELTGNVYPSSASPGELTVLYVTDKIGNVGVVEDDGNTPKAFRCAADPLN